MSRAVRTAVDTRSINDAAVRDLFSQWYDLLPGLDDAIAANDEFRSLFVNPTRLDFRSVVWISTDAHSITHAAASAVDVIQTLADQLEFPRDRVLKAASIKRRTYHSWVEKPEARPRLASQGRLWSLAQCVNDLTTLVGTPGRWLQQSGRMSLFEAGQFEHLVELAVAETRPAFDDPTQGTYTGNDSEVVELPRSGRAPVMRPVKKFRD